MIAWIKLPCTVSAATSNFFFNQTILHGSKWQGSFFCNTFLFSFLYLYFQASKYGNKLNLASFSALTNLIFKHACVYNWNYQINIHSSIHPIFLIILTSKLQVDNDYVWCLFKTIINAIYNLYIVEDGNKFNV